MGIIQNEQKAAIHVLLLLYHAKKLNWAEINRSYVNWSMYQINILVHFYKTNTDDLELSSFISLYEFVMEPTGPLCDLITQALDWLELNKYITSVKSPILTDSGTNEVVGVLLKDPLLIEVEKWIELMVTLQSIYGYEQLYRFIYRDPEFRNKLKSNNPKLETGNPQNDTIEFLNEFKTSYDDVLLEIGNTTSISRKEYLIGYFGYVFDQISRGE